MLRRLFLFLSNRKRLRRWMEHSPQALALTSRFVAGTHVADALRVTRRLNGSGIAVTLDYLGESVRRLEEAAAARDVYLNLLDVIQQSGARSNVSLKLTQFGIDISEQACRDNVAAVVQKACQLSNFVRVDMESSAYTSRTLALVIDLHSQSPNVGVVIQACLRRSEDDVRELNRLGIRVRLCKGAYQEPPEAAFQKKSEVDSNYRRLAELLLAEGTHPAFATHDEAELQSAIHFAGQRQLPKDGFEIQMLYGIRRDLQFRFASAGYPVRVYVPFGEAWYPYFMRRLAERPANAYFVASHLFRD